VHFTTQDIQRIRAGAAELVASVPELIYVWSNPGLAALKQSTQTIPIVFVLVSDPVGTGLVANLARPGGNITGFQNFETAIGGKWLELLKEIAPGVRRVAVVYNQKIAANVAFLHTAEAASPSMGVTVTAMDLQDVAAIEPAFAAFARGPNGGLILTPNPLNSRNTEVISGLAARLHLPAIYPFHLDPVKGGLVSYGFDTVEQQRGAAAYVDRLLKGEKPANLPVQAPTKYQLVINLKTARALGLDVSLQMQQRADEVIE
jgi:putative ABC transport system substrate-binding protein